MGESLILNCDLKLPIVVTGDREEAFDGCYAALNTSKASQRLVSCYSFLNESTWNVLMNLDLNGIDAES